MPPSLYTPVGIGTKRIASRSTAAAIHIHTFFFPGVPPLSALKRNEPAALVCQRAFLVDLVSAIGKLGNIKGFFLAVHRKYDHIFLTFAIFAD